MVMAVATAARQSLAGEVMVVAAAAHVVRAGSDAGGVESVVGVARKDRTACLGSHRLPKREASSLDLDNRSQDSVGTY